MKELLKEYLGKIDISKTIVLLGVVVSFLFTNYALVYVEIPEGNETIFHIFAGVIDTSMINVIGWYFGSSKSSAKKTELIDKMVDKQPQQ